MTIFKLILLLLASIIFCHAQISPPKLTYSPSRFQIPLGIRLNLFDRPIYNLSDWITPSFQVDKSTNQDLVFYFIRHAEGTHNAAETRIGTAKWDATESKLMAYWDAELTSFGKSEAQSQQQEWKKTNESVNGTLVLDKVIVSPLSRAIETAEIILLNPNVRFEARELARERIGVHTCDKRHNRTLLESKFPSIDFSQIQSGDDFLWSADERESEEEIQHRAREFLLQTSEEMAAENKSSVAVVSHSGFIKACLKELQYPVHTISPQNCEVIPLTIRRKKQMTPAFLMMILLLLIGFACVALLLLEKRFTVIRRLLNHVRTYLPASDGRFRNVRYSALNTAS